MKILIVEDDPQVARVISRQLAGEGCEVRSAGSAEEAIELAGRESFQLIMTDINLPGMSGFEAIAPLKEAGAAPVLVMSGYPDGEYAADAKQLGAIGLVGKPLEFEMLKEILIGLAGI